jgi:hypothetical protein
MVLTWTQKKLLGLYAASTQVLNKGAFVLLAMAEVFFLLYFLVSNGLDNFIICFILGK